MSLERQKRHTADRLPAGGSAAPQAALRPILLWSSIDINGQVLETPRRDVTAEILAALQMRPGQAAPGGQGRRRFALRRWPGLWQVFFEWEEAFFADTAGMSFIAHYLKRPGEPIHPVVLLARLLGEDPVQQRSAALDDADATRHYRREMDRLRAVIQDQRTLPARRKVAEEELAQLEGLTAYTHHRTFDQAARAVKSVRQAINRAISLLGEVPDARGGAPRVLGAFAAHLKQHLLDPSQPGLAPAGHLVYEPPPGVSWT